MSTSPSPAELSNHRQWLTVLPKVRKSEDSWGDPLPPKGESRSQQSHFPPRMSHARRAPQRWTNEPTMLFILHHPLLHREGTVTASAPPLRVAGYPQDPAMMSMNTRFTIFICQGWSATLPVWLSLQSDPSVLPEASLTVSSLMDGS